MTLDDLGNLGEFVGAAAVVVSLIYVAVQIRHNIKSVKTQTFESIVGRLIEWHGRTQTPEMARLYVEGCEDFGQLRKEDQLRFGHLMTQLFLVAEMMIDTGDELLKPTTIDGARRFILRLFENQGIREWWSQGKDLFATDFQDYVGRLVERSERPEE